MDAPLARLGLRFAERASLFERELVVLRRALARVPELERFDERRRGASSTVSLATSLLKRLGRPAPVAS